MSSLLRFPHVAAPPANSSMPHAALEEANHAMWLAFASGLCSVLCCLISLGAYLHLRWGTGFGVSAGQNPHHARMSKLLHGYLRQLMFLNIADTIQGAAFLIGPLASGHASMGHPGGTPANAACKAQAILIAVAPLWSAAWTAALATELLRMTFFLQRELRGSFARRRYLVYQAVCWLVPVALVLVAVLVPRTIHGADPSPMDIGPWCWYDLPYGASTANDLAADPVWALYVPKLVLLAGLLVLLVALGTKVACTPTNPARPTQRSKWHALLLYFGGYLLGYVAVTVPPLLLRTSLTTILPFSGATGRGFVMRGPLMWATALLMPAQGVINFLIFVSTNRPIRQQLAMWLRCGRPAAPPPPKAPVHVPVPEAALYTTPGARALSMGQPLLDRRSIQGTGTLLSRPPLGGGELGDADGPPTSPTEQAAAEFLGNEVGVGSAEVRAVPPHHRQPSTDSEAGGGWDAPPRTLEGERAISMQYVEGNVAQLSALHYGWRDARHPSAVSEDSEDGMGASQFGHASSFDALDLEGASLADELTGQEHSLPAGSLLYPSMLQSGALQGPPRG